MFLSLPFDISRFRVVYPDMKGGQLFKDLPAAYIGKLPATLAVLPPHQKQYTENNIILNCK